MNISDLELVKNCQHPYPAAGQAEGLFIYGDNIILPSKCSLLMMETPEKKGIYQVNLKLIPDTAPNSGLRNGSDKADDGPSLNAGVEANPEEHSIQDFCNAALALLNLPSIEEIDQNREILPQINLFDMKKIDEYDVVFNVTRENFERIYRRVAESDYAQVLDEPYIYYVVDRKLDLCGSLLRRIYRQEHPEATFKRGPHGEMEPQLSAVLDRELMLAGMMSYNPIDFHLFEESLARGESGLFYGWYPWAVWMR